MRTSFRILVVIVALVAMVAFPAVAQTAGAFSVNQLDIPPSGKLISLNAIVLTTTTVSSTAFTLSGYIGENTSTYPIWIAYSVDTSDQNAGTEVDSVSLVLQGTNSREASPTWTTVDTLSMTAGTAAYSATSYNLNEKKYAYWRVQAVGKGSNTAALVYIDIYLPRRDAMR